MFKAVLKRREKGNTTDFYQTQALEHNSIHQYKTLQYEYPYDR